ncbi:M14 family metallopeptidase [Algoriphagus zhangzhouensis]|uniref:Zinc carboxypeptidase n=1 Tax=Algoriphagus zhangzhouensis TaxID=1073327 RepID=A0A1M7ZFY0_9BACT|nr:M14 family metallopeptidase [Algoriphagus zhangzhouensis]TDY44883.1 zinc carboxypeptidase [Algoriphagus zhangzhouensis]SHO63825.1 Zinc carboxypeptidase [Algoriphagus zhangzhouensis]
MKKTLLGCLIAASMGWSSLAFGQSDYPTLSQLNQRLQRIGSNASAELKSLTKTAGGKDIWVLKIGTGNIDEKPAIAVVGGVEGYQVVSVELATKFAESLISDHADALEKTTFYIFPNMSPDAYEQYHAELKYERRGNATSVDHDRDGAPGDNGYSDLNGDGYITMMRVEDPMGEYVVSKDDERVMIKADRSKGEAGKYSLYPESKDDDQDGKFAEDLKEGIAFNKSMTYKFPVFEPLAGDIPVSQLESRALLDYLFEQWNIFAFVTFSPANNLSSPLKYSAPNAKKRVVTSILEKDQALNAMVSGIYNETISAKPYMQNNQGTDGDFFQWAYFHFGRLSFGTPGYWTPEFKGKSNEEVNYLAWADSLGNTEVFVPWTEVSHPDFPGKKVEVGGIKPFAMSNPSYDKVDKIAEEHTDFILKLAAIQPSLEVQNLKIESIGNGLTRISLDLFNNSPLPTHSEMGERSRWLRKVRIDFGASEDRLISGEKIQLIDVIPAFGKESLSWIVKGKGDVTMKAGASHVGFINATFKL